MTESLKVKTQLWWERQEDGCGGQSSAQSTCSQVEQLWATPGSANLRMEVEHWADGRKAGYFPLDQLKPLCSQGYPIKMLCWQGILWSMNCPPTVFLVSQKAVGWVVKGRGRLQGKIQYTLRNISQYRIVIIIADIYTLNLSIVWTGWYIVPHSN